MVWSVPIIRDVTAWGTLTTAAVLVTVLSVLLGSSVASAGIGVVVLPIYPAVVIVGDTNVAVSVTLFNVSTPPESGGTVTLSLIRHTPSCGTDTTPCPAGQEDPGVFLVKGFPDGKAHARAGTACGDPAVPGGATFTISAPNPTTGEVELVPDLGSVVVPASGDVTCTIDFFVDVLKLPTKNAGPGPGIQTAQLARARGTASVSGVTGVGTGSGVTTVQERLPKEINCGDPLIVQLDADVTSTFRFTAASASAVSISVSDTSGTIGLLELRLFGPDGGLIADTCTGRIDTHVNAGLHSIQVSDCIGADTGSYTLTLSCGNAGLTNDACTSATRISTTPYADSVGTAATTVAIVNLSGGAASPPSPPNVLVQTGSLDPVTFTLNFNAPRDSVAFTRPMLVAGSSGITHPLWSAHALNALGQEISTVGEGLIASFTNVPAQTFTLSGPGITAVRVDSNNEHFAAFSAVLIDDLTLSSGCAPPASPTPPSAPTATCATNAVLNFDSVDASTGNVDATSYLGNFGITLSGVTTPATTEAGDPTPSCGKGARSKSVWYQFTAPSDGTISADTFGSSYDTVLSVFSGSCGTLTGTEVACNDDTGGSQSQVSFAAAAGATYHFMVSAFKDDGGTLVFNVTSTSSRTLTPTTGRPLTSTPSPTPTPLPAIPFVFASGGNQYLCAFNLAFNPPLLFSVGSNPFDLLARQDPVNLRDLYKVVYVAPDLATDDYTLLRQMVAPGGFIEQFVNLGGVAVLNGAGTLGDQANIAPGGVGFSSVAQHVSEQILRPLHPYITGTGFGGEVLGSGDFANWQPTDYGTLTNLPVNAAVLLANNDGPSLAEYQYGAGRVIVSTLAYCWDGKPGSQGAATRNLLRYSQFYSGSAQTPGPTVTQTGTATPTRTATRIATATTLRSPTATATPTPSPIILLGDVNGDGVVDRDDVPSLIEALFIDVPPLEADVNADGAVSAADIPALLVLLQ